MADVNKRYLDLSGLTQYDKLIKKYFVVSGDTTGFTTVSKVVGATSTTYTVSNVLSQKNKDTLKELSGTTVATGLVTDKLMVDYVESEQVSIDESDKILEVTENNTLKTTLSAKYEGGYLYIYGKPTGDTNVEIAKVDLASSLMKDSVLYDTEAAKATTETASITFTKGDGTTAGPASFEGLTVGHQYIFFAWKTESGTAEPTYTYDKLDVSEILKAYTAGDNSIEITEDNKIKVKIADTTEISVGTSGITLSEKIARVGTSGDTKDSDTIEGAKRYADDVAANVKVSAGNGISVENNKISVKLDETTEGVKNGLQLSENGLLLDTITDAQIQALFDTAITD